MRSHTTAVILVGLFAGASTGLSARPAATDPAPTQIAQTYCATCHNGVTRSLSGATLDRLDPATIADNPAVWSRAYRQLQAGTMPPVGAPRPDAASRARLLASIETALGADAPLPADATNQEIADRLATLLWNGAPDARLLADARQHLLTQPAALETQVRRMLADPRADAFVSGFFFPWLGLDQLAKAEPDAKYFPEYDAALRDAMTTETDLFIRSQLRDDRDPVDLWNADYTFLNERLARHYGIAGITGAQFRRVTLPTPARYGLLGQGSILMVTSRHQVGHDSPYTSPAARSTWVQRHFLGAPPPMPFPGARPVSPDRPITPQTRALPAEPCVACHRNFFPLGYGLEHFDPIGAWRTDDQAGPVDASGALVDGTPFNGSADLREALLRYSDAFRTTITERLLLYADGKPANQAQPTPETLVRARQILHGAQPTRWSSVVAAIVRMKPSSSGS
ncbi:MAG TPA: DUF1592 domain-containing protein [Vicinamibacterales bacterium]|nr:DUF1592 domain-containing protein [Vicinamibacterales bacterium]